MRYLNFPTVVVFKSSKLLPVMAMNAIMLRQRQKHLDIMAAVLLCLGLVLFSIADSKSHPEFRPYGVLLVLCSLCADACICNLQEATMQSYHTPVLEMVLFSHAFALLFLLPAAAVVGEVAAGVWWLSLHPGAFCLMVLFCMCGFLGECKFHPSNPCAYPAFLCIQTRVSCAINPKPQACPPCSASLNLLAVLPRSPRQLFAKPLPCSFHFWFSPNHSPSCNAASECSYLPRIPPTDMFSLKRT